MITLFWLGFLCGSLAYGVRTGNDLLATAGALLALVVIDRAGRKRTPRGKDVKKNE